MEQYINQRKLSAAQPAVQPIRRAVTRATERQFGPHAQAQLQGSAYSSVALRGVSDVDFYVWMSDQLPDVTRAGRVDFAARLQQELAAEGVRCAAVTPREKRVLGAGCGGAPDFDVVFARCSVVPPAVPPERHTLTHAEQLAVCFLRLLPLELTNLRQPQASALCAWAAEEAASARLADAFPRLLRHLLERLRDGEPQGFAIALERAASGRLSARDDLTQWRGAAARVLRLLDSSNPWP